ncbi:MAG: hypothetical protein IT428_12230 [Planctomycetaceae bacterium]|nr:hypothetical protein [Planctomycetaceae bacterium]
MTQRDFRLPARPSTLPSRRQNPAAGWVFTRSLFNSMEKVARKNKDVAAMKAAERTQAAKDAADATQDVKRKPVTTIRVDDCSASVWTREYIVQGQPKIFYSVTLERSYKDRDGAWRYTRSFDAESLGKVMHLCTQASEAIDGLKQQDAAK